MPGFGNSRLAVEGHGEWRDDGNGRRHVRE
jgi:hypothetical protein